METTEIIGKKPEDIKQLILGQVDVVKKRHEQIKAEMIKILDATKVLEIEYTKLNEELYQLEDEYVNLMKSLDDE